MNLFLLTFLFLSPLSWAQDLGKVINTIGETLIKEAKATRPYGNAYIAPAAIIEAVALLYNGANGETASTIAKGFGFPSVADTNSQLQTLLPELRDDKGTQYATVARKVHVLNKFQVNDEFKAVAKKVYSADVYNTDLSEGLESLSIINRCVAEETRDVIEDVLLYASLKYDTKFVSVLGWFVQGPWAFPFDPAETSQASFSLDANTKFPVETMTLQATLNYAEDTQLGVKYLELPFAGSAASLIVVLPTEVEGLDKIVQKIEQTDNPSFQKQTVKLSLPKLQIKARWDVKKLIQKVTGDSSLGGKDDDFSKIAGKKGDIQLDVVEQVGYIRINEAGILIPQIPEGVKVPQPPQGSGANVKEFKVDHPFLFRIVRSGVIVCRGFVQDPSVALANYILN